jgi:hypothetical protein
MLENSPCKTPCERVAIINQKATTHMKDALHRFNNYRNFGLVQWIHALSSFFKAMHYQ